MISNATFEPRRLRRVRTCMFQHGKGKSHLTVLPDWRDAQDDDDSEDASAIAPKGVSRAIRK